jgi:hypothetical protein
MSPSKFNLARSAKKNLFTQPLKTSFGAKRRKKPFYTTSENAIWREAPLKGFLHNLVKAF